MTAKDIYLRALISLGYADDQVFKNKAVVIINQVYDELYNSLPHIEYLPIVSLNDEVNYPPRICMGAMVYGVAERLALGEGDGEKQQYFAMQFDRAKAKIVIIDSVQDSLPR